MRYSKLIRTLYYFMLSSLFISSCIDENHEGCVQYAVTARLVDSKGNTLPGSTIDSMKAYLFINDKFDHQVTPESDGRYLISFDGEKKTALVAFGLPGSDSLSVRTPEVGDDINTLSAGISSNSSKAKDTLNVIIPSELYYGRFDYVPNSTDINNNNSLVMKMTNIEVTLHVVVKQLHQFYDDGSDYSVVLSDLRSGITFGGSVAGNSITCMPKMSFDANGNLCSDAFHTFPTKSGESVTVSVYKSKSLIWQSSEDDEGKDITLSAGEDKCIVIDVGSSNMSLQVMSWKDYIQQNTSL